MSSKQEVDTEWVKLTEGIPGADSPVFTIKGDLILTGAHRKHQGEFAGQIYKVAQDTGELSVLCEPRIKGYGGAPCNCQCDRDGALWVADMRLGLLRLTTDGTCEQIRQSDDYGGAMMGCNDCVFDYHGNLWLTAVGVDIAPAPFEPWNLSLDNPISVIYCRSKDGTLSKHEAGINLSNGIAVQHSADGTPMLLIVAETFSKRLWSFDILGAGKLGNKRLWGTMPGGTSGGADGLDFDEKNNLLAAHYGSKTIDVFPPEGGSPVYRIPCPFDNPTNLHFKPHTNTLFVTEHDTNGVWTGKWKHNGKLHFRDL